MVSRMGIEPTRADQESPRLFENARNPEDFSCEVCGRASADRCSPRHQTGAGKHAYSSAVCCLLLAADGRTLRFRVDLPPNQLRPGWRNWLTIEEDGTRQRAGRRRGPERATPHTAKDGRPAALSARVDCGRLCAFSPSARGRTADGRDEASKRNRKQCSARCFAGFGAA
jgi:hypothetical protein